MRKIDQVHIPDQDEDKRAERLAPMTFNMPKDWHVRFKITAVQHGMNMKELLIEAFDAWEREKGLR